jgi:hypothetical protein
VNIVLDHLWSIHFGKERTQRAVRQEHFLGALEVDGLELIHHLGSNIEMVLCLLPLAGHILIDRWLYGKSIVLDGLFELFPGNALRPLLCLEAQFEQDLLQVHFALDDGHFHCRRLDKLHTQLADLLHQLLRICFTFFILHLVKQLPQSVDDLLPEGAFNILVPLSLADFFTRQPFNLLEINGLVGNLHIDEVLRLLGDSYLLVWLVMQSAWLTAAQEFVDGSLIILD